MKSPVGSMRKSCSSSIPTAMKLSCVSKSVTASGPSYASTDASVKRSDTSLIYMILMVPYMKSPMGPTRKSWMRSIPTTMALFCGAKISTSLAPSDAYTDVAVTRPDIYLMYMCPMMRMNITKATMKPQNPRKNLTMWL